MSRHITTLAIGLLILSGAGAARAQMTPPPGAAATPPATSAFLKPGEVDPALILPPPPADGSPAAIADLAKLHSLIAGRTPERLADAQHDAQVENVTSITSIFGPALDLDHFPATAKLFSDLRNEDSVEAKAAKKIFHRPRPWEQDQALAADPALAGCVKGDPETSYPSGHAMMGYAAAEVLAQLMPGNAQIILARGADYAESRVICGVHYPSDTEASHVLATALVVTLMSKPAFAAEVEAARAELTAAHIAP